MNTKYEIKLVAKDERGNTVTVETLGFNNKELVKYHVKTLNNYIETSSYFNQHYTDGKVQVTENADWKPMEYTQFEWTKEDGKYIR